MDAFFAATPLQLINAINLRTAHKTDDADLFLLSFAADMEPFQALIEQTRLFEHVYVLSQPLGNANERLCTRLVLQQFLFPPSSLTKLLNHYPYRAMYSSRIGIANDFYYTMLKKKNPQLRFFYYEEGVGDYFCPIERPHSKTTQLLSIMGYKNPFKTVQTLYVYHPEALLENTDYPAEKITPFSKNTNAMALLDRLFPFDPSYIPSHVRLLYLDQPFMQQQGIFVDHTAILTALCSVVGKEYIAVRMHPTRNRQDNPYTTHGFFVLPENHTPWEVLCAKLDLSNVVLAAVNSTAALTPLTMLGKQANVLLLFNALDQFAPLGSEKQEQYFLALKRSYPHSLSIPSSLEEAAQIFQRLIDKNGRMNNV